MCNTDKTAYIDGLQEYSQIDMEGPERERQTDRERETTRRDRERDEVYIQTENVKELCKNGQRKKWQNVTGTDALRLRPFF